MRLIAHKSAVHFAWQAKLALAGMSLTVPLEMIVKINKLSFCAEKLWFEASTGDYVKLAYEDIVADLDCENAEAVIELKVEAVAGEIPQVRPNTIKVHSLTYVSKLSLKPLEKRRETWRLSRVTSAICASEFLKEQIERSLSKIIEETLQSILGGAQSNGCVDSGGPSSGVSDLNAPNDDGPPLKRQRLSDVYNDSASTTNDLVEGLCAGGAIVRDGAKLLLSNPAATAVTTAALKAIAPEHAENIIGLARMLAVFDGSNMTIMKCIASSAFSSTGLGALVSSPSSLREDSLGDDIPSKQLKLPYLAAQLADLAYRTSKDDLHSGLPTNLRMVHFSPSEASLQDMLTGAVAPQWYACVDDNSNRLFIVIRGTANIAEWLSNVHGVATPEMEPANGPRFHSGFLRAARCMMNQSGLLDVLSEQKAGQLILVGHSLGGAIALLLLTANLLPEDGPTPKSVFAFGAPAFIHCEDFAKIKSAHLGTCEVHSFVHGRDAVPRLLGSDLPVIDAVLNKLHSSKLLGSRMGQGVVESTQAMREAARVYGHLRSMKLTNLSPTSRRARPVKEHCHKAWLQLSLKKLAQGPMDALRHHEYKSYVDCLADASKGAGSSSTARN